MDGTAESGKAGEPADELDGMARTAVVVEACRGSKSVGVLYPELESLGAHVSAKCVDQKPSKARMMSLSKHFPDVRIRQSLEGSDFQLQQMILIRVQVNGVDTPGVGSDEIIKQVISCAGQAKDGVVVFDLQEALIHPRIFPSECIEIVLIELRMFPQVLVVVYARLVVLVKGTRKGRLALRLTMADWYAFDLASIGKAGSGSNGSMTSRPVAGLSGGDSVHDASTVSSSCCVRAKTLSQWQPRKM